MQEKINQLNSSNDDDNSVVLAAVLGTLGGLVLVAVVGFFAYKYIKKTKARKQTLGTSNEKVSVWTRDNEAGVTQRQFDAARE